MSVASGKTRPRLGLWGWCAVVFGSLSAIVLIVSLWSFVSTLFVPAAESIGNPAGDQAKNELYRKDFDKYLAQLDGRSLFIVPGSPIAPEPKNPNPKPDEPKKPTTYGGPKIIAMINDSVWFDDGKKLTVGGEKEGDIQVLSIQPPWFARISYQGEPFSVAFLARDMIVMPEKRPDKPEADTVAEGTKDSSAGDAKTDKTEGGKGEPGKPVEPGKDDPKSDPKSDPKTEPKPEPKPGDPPAPPAPPKPGEPAPSGTVPPPPPSTPPSDPTPKGNQ